MGLSDIALEDLKKSGLNDKTIKEMGCFSLPDGKEKGEWLKENLGYSKRRGVSIPQATQDIVCFPYHVDEQYSRIKLYPSVDKAKYLAPKGSKCHLYSLKRDRDKFRKRKKPIIFHEGEKKTALIAQEMGDDYLSIGSSGITQWKDCPEWKQISLKSRVVYICFDQPEFVDGMEKKNPDLEQQKLSLFCWLIKKRAIPKILRWKKEFEKIDDLIAAQEKESRRKSMIEVIKSAVENIFDDIKDVDAHYLADMLANHKFSEAEIAILWDRYKVRNKTKINKTTIKNMVKSSKIDHIRDNAPQWTEVSDKGKITVIPGKLAKCVIDEYAGGNNLIFHQQDFWSYDKKNGVWVEEKESGGRIKAFIQKKLGSELAKKAIIEDVFYQVKNFCIQTDNDFDFNKNPEILNLKNGVLDLSTMDLMDHDRDYYFTAKMNAAYNKNAKCPTWKKFLKQTELKPETILRLQEWFGYCLTPDTRLQKSLFIKGPGSNGKSIILDTLKKILSEYSSSMDLSEAFERFNKIRLRNKLVNFSPDANTNACIGSEYKNASAGGWILAEQKGKDPVEFKCDARFIAAANNFFPTKDKSHGYFRRWEIIHIEKTWVDEEINYNLQNEIFEEIDGILIWALEGLDRLRKNEYKMTHSDEINDAIEEYKEAVNPLQQFVDECCEIRYDPEVQTLATELYGAYSMWCQETGHQRLSKSKVTRDMKQIYPKVDCVRYQVHGKKYKYYTNIKIVPHMEI